MTRCQNLAARCVPARVAQGGGALSIVISTASILCVAGGASAAITSVSGQATLLGSPPASCGPGALTGLNAFAWDEQQNTLQNLVVNETQNPGGSASPVPGFVSGVYDSHFIHYEGIPGVINATGTVTFAQPIVAVIFPVIANESGNTGQQSLAVTLRGLVLGQIRKELIIGLIAKEVAVGILVGTLVGFCFALTIWFMNLTGIMPELTWRLGLVAGIATTGSMTIACLVGASIPLVLDRLRFDPATASSIFLTMLTDFVSYGVFLTIAFLMRSFLGVHP